MAHYPMCIGLTDGEKAVVNSGRRMAFVTLAAGCAAAALAPAAGAARAWMGEDTMRTAFIGKTLDGQYVNGERWTETYTADGRLDYSESARKGVGYWYFRGHVFCTLYDPGQGLNGGCFTALQPSSNCYEFYIAGLNEGEADKESSTSWVARAWRPGEPSTCESRPTV
jgi:hypothetical protein